MNNKEILHEILKGMCPYESCGVPKIYWKLAQKLTSEVYGRKGLKLLNSMKSTFDDSVDCRTEIILHTINGEPKELIKLLETNAKKLEE